MKERWKEMLEFQQKVQAMTDLARSELLDIVACAYQGIWTQPLIARVTEILVAARREGAAAEREKVAMWMIERSIPTGHGDTVEDLLAELRARVAEEMRERAKAVAASAYDMFGGDIAAIIGNLPLTPEEPR